jgi:hypothetical protein
MIKKDDHDSDSTDGDSVVNVLKGVQRVLETIVLDADAACPEAVMD